MTRVLVVEDDEAMAVALRDGFAYEGHEVTVARDGEEGLRMAREDDPELMILDVMLPKMTGLEVCKLLRGEGSQLPIIMLTARGQEIDKVLGLKLGADDYVTKPFSFMELMARVEAVLRRTRPNQGSQRPIHEFGDVVRGSEPPRGRTGREANGTHSARIPAARLFPRAPGRGRDPRTAARRGMGL